jgi:hypothetical protein
MYAYTAEIADPPPGWNGEIVDVRHQNIPADQIGHACSALLKLSYEFWLRAERSGNAALFCYLVDLTSHPFLLKEQKKHS